ncbi:MAG: hypothetical protein HXY24_14220 [Rubrivivax sp.]|nr:hypothetical protein [Rubrivivax sp.]
MRVSRQGIDEIKRRNDLCEVVIEHGIELRKRGRSYFGLCPFHQEKTGSFAVRRESGLFHCFGCGASGDVIGFLVRFHQISFREALQRLASRVGIELETWRVTSDQWPEESRRLLHAQAAVRFTRLVVNGRRS